MPLVFILASDSCVPTLRNPSLEWSWGKACVWREDPSQSIHRWVYPGLLGKLPKERKGAFTFSWLFDLICCQDEHIEQCLVSQGSWEERFKVSLIPSRALRVTLKGASGSVIDCDTPYSMISDRFYSTKPSPK